MARKYEVTVTGEGTSGAFELFCAHQDGGPLWSTGSILVSARPVDLINALMPGLDARVEMGQDKAVSIARPYAIDKLTGPKSWVVTLDGTLYGGIGHQNGSSRLTGRNSPGLIILDMGHVDDRSKGAGIETPANSTKPVGA